MEDEMAESAARMKEQQAQEAADRKALAAKVREQFQHAFVERSLLRPTRSNQCSPSSHRALHGTEL
jgi:hypothetical protein